MALDNAQFPSELSIVDPPGTDPLSEGDDQIRTAKRVVFQGFEFVDKAVLLTADQMNEAAIKNEANIFTVQQTFQQDVIRVVQGANESGLYFCNSETSFRRWAFGRENTTASGDFIFQRRDAAGAIQNTPIVLTEADGQILVSSGTALNPQYAFQSNSNIGMYRFSANVLGFATGGVARMTVTNSGIRSNIAGSAGAPSYSFNDDADTGMFALLGNQFAFAAGGVERLRIKTATVNMTLPTSSAGLSSGDCFESTGFVAIVP